MTSLIQMSGGSHTFCSQCGARLRRGRAPGSWCDPCTRKGPSVVLPPGFYETGPLLDALGNYDFGAVFRAVRAETGLSQQALGDLIGMEQRRVSEIERGTRPLRDVRQVAGVVTAVGIPPALLGFAHPSTVNHTGVIDGQKGSWMDRRNFVTRVAGITLGVATAGGLDTDRLLALLPQAEPTGTRQISAEDVQVIDQLATAFSRQDFAHGAGLFRDAAVAQLRTVLPLLDAKVSPDARSDLMVATARLASQSGWMSFEVELHEDARKLWMIALELARDANNQRGNDLASFIHVNMANQAQHLGRPDEALHLIRIGQAVSMGANPASASTNCHLASLQAVSLAAQGDSAACDLSLRQAEDHFSAVDPTDRWPWGSYLNDASLASDQGWTRYTLSSVQHDPRIAGQAVDSLRYAVDNLSPGYARLRATNLANLAGAHALAGDIDTAVTVGHQAVEAVTAVHSPRSRERLRVLDGVLEPLNSSPGVPELRHGLATAAA